MNPAAPVMTTRCFIVSLSAEREPRRSVRVLVEEARARSVSHMILRSRRTDQFSM